MNISSSIKNTNIEFFSDCSLSQGGHQMHSTFYIIIDYHYVICFYINYELIVYY